MGIKSNLYGQKFNNLLVDKHVSSDKKGNSRWQCTCDCGRVVIVRSDHLKSGSTKSCGCKAKNFFKTHNFSLKHGHARKGFKSRTYSSWNAMHSRCYRKSYPFYEIYGGRGIVVCDQWKNNFKNFLSDMGERPEGKTLDRINSDGNYEPSNCRWATPKEQIHNRRKNVK